MARTIRAPAVLTERMERALGERLALDASGAADACAATAAELLGGCLDWPPEGAQRPIALDLLAADALITYACEAAAELPDGTGWARAEMVRCCDGDRVTARKQILRFAQNDKRGER